MCYSRTPPPCKLLLCSRYRSQLLHLNHLDPHVLLDVCVNADVSRRNRTHRYCPDGGYDDGGDGAGAGAAGLPT